MSRDTSFYYSFLVLPAAQRDAIVTVWDACRAIDDAVDEAPDPAAAAAAGARSGATRSPACSTAARRSPPQGRALQPVAAAFALPRRAVRGPDRRRARWT